MGVSQVRGCGRCAWSARASCRCRRRPAPAPGRRGFPPRAVVPGSAHPDRRGCSGRERPASRARQCRRKGGVAIFVLDLPCRSQRPTWHRKRQNGRGSARFYRPNLSVSRRISAVFAAVLGFPSNATFNGNETGWFRDAGFRRQSGSGSVALKSRCPPSPAMQFRPGLGASDTTPLDIDIADSIGATDVFAALTIEKVVDFSVRGSAGQNPARHDVRIGLSRFFVQAGDAFNIGCADDDLIAPIIIEIEREGWKCLPPPGRRRPALSCQAGPEPFRV